MPEDQAAIFIPNKEDTFIFSAQRGTDAQLEEPIHSLKPQQQQLKKDAPLKKMPPEEYLEELKQSIPTRKILGNMISRPCVITLYWNRVHNDWLSFLQIWFWLREGICISRSPPAASIFECVNTR